LIIEGAILYGDDFDKCGGDFNQVIKSQNTIIYTVVDVLNLYSLKIIKIFKTNHIRRSIEACKPNIIVTAVPSMQLTFP
jgi:hypothetical protein